MNQERSNLFYFVVFLILGFTVYGHSLNYGYVLDDFFQVVNNPQVHDLGQWTQYFTGSTMAANNQLSGIYYKPLMMLTYSLLWNAGGGSSFYFHLFQLLLHILNAFLIFKLFRHFFQNKEKWAALAAAVYLLHPINAEATLFIADLQEPLYTFFGLSALLVLIRFNRIIPTALLLLCALLSKETGFLYTVMALAYIVLFKKEKLKPALIFIPAVLGVYFYLRLGLADLSSLHAYNMQISRATTGIRLMTMPKVLIHYLHLFIYPHNFSLTQDWVVSQINMADFFIPLTEVLAVIIAGLLCYVKTKSKIFLFFFLWFLAGWGLHSQIIPLDGTVSDRWFYFTMIGLLGALGMFYTTITNRNFVIVVLIIPLSLISYQRSLDWQSALALYGHDLQLNPDSFYLNNNYGLELSNAGKYTESLPYFEKTISLSAPGTAAWYAGTRNLGNAYMFMGQFERAEPLLASTLPENDVRSFRAMAWCLSSQNKTAELKPFLEQALKKFPQDPVLLKFIAF